MRNKWFFVALMMLTSTVSLQASDYSFRLKNSLGFARHNETVEVEVRQDIDLSSMTLRDREGREIPFELCGEHSIRFQCSIANGKVAEYVLTEGKRQQPHKVTYAAIKVPSSRSDIAWENDYSAYRMYSSVLLAHEPNTGNGVDLWSKKKDVPVIDAMYNLSNYHNESEYGVDAYSVNGKRMGVGGVSHVVGGKLVIHAPHNKCTVQENNALRSTFTLTYNQLVVDGVAYTKILTISTVAGSLLNKATVRYEPVQAGTGKPMKLAVALYQHTDMAGLQVEGKSYTTNPGVAGWAENKSEGSVNSADTRFYQGCYVPDDKAVTEVIDHHLCVTVDYQPGTDLTYYFGGGWSVFPQGMYTCDEDWFDALDRFKATVESPLVQTSWQEALPQKDEVIALLNKANLHWQQSNPTHGDHFWNRAVYHTGNMEAYKVTGEQQYLDYSQAWAERNRYWGQTGTDKSRWKYSYGESADYVLFGDNQICFQIYADLFMLQGGEDKIARAREVMEYEMSTDKSDYLWWVDGFYMVMPVMTKLYRITGNQQYLDKMYEYWRWGTDLMWDEEAGLYYRDKNYLYPSHQTSAGQKDFWARGDGWIFAALARVLEELPEDDAHREEYKRYYLRLAESLAACQRLDDKGNGYWSRSLLDEPYAPGYETSGTALNVFGFAWGINHGILDETRYGITLQRGWNYLKNVALQENGTVGYVQPIGSNAAPGTYITATQTADFGVGAFLLAMSEMSRYAAGEQSANPLRVAYARLEESNVISVTFNNALAEDGLHEAGNYHINGEAVKATHIAFDGNKTVRITLEKPLDYGRYQLHVEGLTSLDGMVLSPDNLTTLLRTVPATPNTVSMTVTAIGAQSGNPAANVVDNNAATRWSQEGKQQWLQFDLKESKPVYAVDIAFYQGNTRVNYFDVRTSVNGSDWTDVLTGAKSSGKTTEMERYAFPATTEARYVRIYCNGANTSTWNSLTEARVRLASSSSEEVPLIAHTYTDILLPLSTASGDVITWTSSRPEVMTNSGVVTATAEEQVVTMTAHYGGQEDKHDIVVLPRTPEKTLQLRYDFEEQDVYTVGTKRWLKDHSGRARDAQLMNRNCRVDGTLNLMDNTATSFSNNGYVLVPAHLLDSLRSYTVLFTATPTSLSNLPRFYDFGSGSANSLFLRAGSLAAGMKYKGGATQLIAGGDLRTGAAQQIAVTFDARTHTTTVFVDGQQVVQSTDVAYEPYQLTESGVDRRNYIGRTQWWDTSSKNGNVDYQGTLDNFRLYAMCLSAQELASIFDDLVTGVDTVRQTDGSAPSEEAYDLTGRKVNAKTARGIVILRGKKLRVNHP